MPSRLHDARIRGWIALIVTSAFFGVPVLVVLTRIGDLSADEDLKQFLETWVL